MPYLTLLRAPYVVRLLLGSLIGRLPGAMVLIGMPLVLRHAGADYAFVGVASGVLAVATAVGGPLAGRLVDRIGQVRVLVPTLLISSAGYALIAVAPGSRVPVLAGAVLCGMAAPPLEPCLRTLWPGLVPADRLEAAYSIDSAAQEMIFVSAPLVVAGCVAWASAVAALWVGVVLGAVGVTVMVGAPPVRRWRAQQRAADWLGPLRHGGLAVLLLGFVGVGSALGMLNVLLVDYAERHHVAGGAPVLFALNAVGSLAGALVYGAVKWRGSPVRRMLWLKVGLAVSYTVLCVTPPPGLMVVAMLLTGVFLAPLLTVTFVLVGELAPQGTATEAFAWIVTLFTTGASIGAAATGYLLDHRGMGAAAWTGVIGITLSVLLQLAGGRFAATRADVAGTDGSEPPAVPAPVTTGG